MLRPPASLTTLGSLRPEWERVGDGVIASPWVALLGITVFFFVVNRTVREFCCAGILGAGVGICSSNNCEGSWPGESEACALPTLCNAPITLASTTPNFSSWSPPPFRLLPAHQPSKFSHPPQLYGGPGLPPLSLRGIRRAVVHTRGLLKTVFSPSEVWWMSRASRCCGRWGSPLLPKENRGSTFALRRPHSQLLSW